MATTPFLNLVAAKLSVLGPRSEFTEASGSTGLSHSQQIQLSCSPTVVRSLITQEYVTKESALAKKQHPVALNNFEFS